MELKKHIIKMLKGITDPEQIICIYIFIRNIIQKTN